MTIYSINYKVLGITNWNNPNEKLENHLKKLSLYLSLPKIHQNLTTPPAKDTHNFFFDNPNTGIL